MTDEQEPHRLGLVYAPDIIETDSGPIDEGTRRALLEQVLIPDASPTAYEILDHAGLDISRRPDGTLEIRTSFDGVYAGGLDESAFDPEPSG